MKIPSFSFNFFLALLFVLGLSACQMFQGSKETRKDYSYFKKTRPSSEVIKTNKPKLNKVGKQVASIYGQTTNILKDYIKHTEVNRTYKAFVNDTSGMTKKQKDKYIQKQNKKTKEKIKEARDKVIKNMPVQSVKELNKYLSKALKLQKSAMEVATKYMKKPSAGIASVVKGSTKENKTYQSVKNMKKQIVYTVEALKFLKRQYDFHQRATSHSGR